MGDFTEPLGLCSLEDLSALLGYLDADTITGLCVPEDGSDGCSGVQDCLTRYTLARIDAADARAGDVAMGLDVSFLLTSAYLVFVMQLGMNILLKNVLDACVGAMGFYLFGYAFAFGHGHGRDSNGFIGNWNFALSYTTQTSFSGEEFATFGWHNFFFHSAYLLYSFFLSSFVYPVVVHWVWDSQGWLSAFNTKQDGYSGILRTGAIDFAGSGVVHMTGGFAALMGAAILGPRVGRFSSDGTVNEMKGHSATLVVMGTFLLWFGWFGFNPVALAGGAGGIAMLFFKYYTTHGAWDVVAVCNGVLAGLVAVTSSCSVIEPWAAILVGASGAVVFCFFDHLTLYTLKVDDPVSAFALHGGVGMWGVLFPGFLAKHDYVVEVYGAYGFGMDAKEGKRFGLLYGGHGQVLLVQVIEILAIIGWTCFTMGAFFMTLKMAGVLRVSVDTELAGLDITNYSKTAGGPSAHNGHEYEEDFSGHTGEKGLAP
ncbi:Ammonium transporter 1 member 1 [Tetrabaena socialis]|uniref:Ammonium transporter 1 member 1 n=1 Tax=Tetrabaena socialis TaxID=47790 RepID=A0A2J8AFB8_9CHLO|nr:Ammonium transporter 1 member 1 [Tetrabaena socialis]|eukprot:PNH11211.1 Ammonium transporter 1 member 1 [Tetrabaena socialis]